jgi:hypothetical protein
MRWLLRVFLGLALVLGCAPRDRRPPNIPETATFVRGDSESHWLECTPTQNEVFDCTVWTEDGRVWTRGSFRLTVPAGAPLRSPVFVGDSGISAQTPVVLVPVSPLDYFPDERGQ